MSDFAKAQLLKFGWTEGKGLGKNENGIVQALKPKLKFDTSGVGHQDLEFEWWDCVYDKALKNIVLENKSNEVSIKIAKENAFNISSTKHGLEVSKKKHSLHYGKFLKTCTLQDGNLMQDNSCQFVQEETSDIQKMIKMSDEDLFKACGGRTAHKGARHGLTLNGKLARIAEQEKQLIAAGYLKSKIENSDKVETKLKKKKKKKRDMEIEDCTSALDDKIIEEVDYDCVVPQRIQSDHDYKPSRKTCKKVKRKINDLSLQLTKSCMIDDDAIKNQQDTSEEKEVRKKCKNKKNKSKRKRNQDSVDCGVNGLKLDNDVLMEPSTKKLKKHKNVPKSSTWTTEESEQEKKSPNYAPCDETKLRKNHTRCRKGKGYHKLKDPKFAYCTKAEAERLNRKIKRKKDQSLKRKQEKKYGKLLSSLLAVSLETDPTKEIVSNKFKSFKKIHKEK